MSYEYTTKSSMGGAAGGQSGGSVTLRVAPCGQRAPNRELQAELDEWYPGIMPRVVGRLDINCYVGSTQSYRFSYATSPHKAYRVRIIGHLRDIKQVENFKGGTHKVFDVVQKS
jgi:hypothetical protein